MQENRFRGTTPMNVEREFSSAGRVAKRVRQEYFYGRRSEPIRFHDETWIWSRNAPRRRLKFPRPMWAIAHHLPLLCLSPPPRRPGRIHPLRQRREKRPARRTSASVREFHLNPHSFPHQRIRPVRGAPGPLAAEIRDKAAIFFSSSSPFCFRSRRPPFPFLVDPAGLPLLLLRRIVFSRRKARAFRGRRSRIRPRRRRFGSQVRFCLPNFASGEGEGIMDFSFRYLTVFDLFRWRRGHGSGEISLARVDHARLPFHAS